jgi:hypothetical protein
MVRHYESNVTSSSRHTRLCRSEGGIQPTEDLRASNVTGCDAVRHTASPVPAVALQRGDKFVRAFDDFRERDRTSGEPRGRNFWRAPEQVLDLPACRSRIARQGGQA